MAADTTVRARIDSETKARAAEDKRIPNAETVAAIRELERGGGERSRSVDALFEEHALR